MRSGKLRHRIIIQQKTATRGTFGEEIETWTTYHSCWAEIDPPKGREFFASQQKQTDVTVRIVIRYKSGITTKMRVKFGTRIYDINAVIDPDERHNRGLILECTEHIWD